ncbi:hypothetical protein CV093_07940 [Oceanobacillus sp. 143]|nr:hypothetical protein CV093_07940 [Oceanobacillus sp. 143]
MFFGRNSSFSFYNKEEMKRYDTCICVGDYEHMETIHADRIIMINPQKSYRKLNPDSITTLLASHLFGEWMPMTEKGYYRNQEFIAFQSNEFIENAIYIEDFSERLIHCLQSGNLPSNIEVKSEHSNGKESKENGDSIYICSSLQLEQRMTALQKQYQLIKEKNK